MAVFLGNAFLYLGYATKWVLNFKSLHITLAFTVMGDALVTVHAWVCFLFPTDSSSPCVSGGTLVIMSINLST